VVETPVERHLDGRDAFVDFVSGRFRLHDLEILMRPGVMADAVSGCRNLAHQVRMIGGGPADQEKGGAHTLLGERRQYLAIRWRRRTVVECQHDLTVA
jgi:hypothetical protein